MGKIIELLRKTLFIDDCNCIVCGKEIPRKGNIYGLCEECYNALERNDGRICERCGKVMNNEAYFCLNCQNNVIYFERARSALIYKGSAAKQILGLKFHRKKYYAKYIAKYIEDTYHKYGFSADIAIPAPISAGRLRERGYNQSAEILKYADIPCRKEYNLVVKEKETPPQTSLSGKERRENIIGAYKITAKQLVKGKKILIIDDIITTGSTVNEIARILMQAGAERVEAITVACAEYKLPSDNRTDMYGKEDYTDYQKLF